MQGRYELPQWVPKIRIHTSHVRAIPAARRGRNDRTGGYSALDLRGRLSSGIAFLSPRRRLAAILPLMVALVSWFALPSYADTYKLPPGEYLKGANWGHITSGWGTDTTGPVDVYSGTPAKWTGETNVGLIQLFDNTTGHNIEAYCIDIATTRDATKPITYNPEGPYDPAAMSDAQRKISYIENNMYVGGPYDGTKYGTSLDVNLEAASVQLALWSYSNNVSLTTDSVKLTKDIDARYPDSATTRSTVLNRAQAIVAWVESTLPAVLHPELTLSFPAAPIPVDGAVDLTVHANADVALHTQVALTAANGVFTDNNASTETVTIYGADTTVHMKATAPGTLSVSATAQMNVDSYVKLVPTGGSSQAFAVPSPYALPIPANATAIHVLTPPAVTIHKSVTNDATGDSGDSVTAMAGGSVTFTVAYGNTGETGATDTVITDPLDTTLGGQNLEKLSDITPQNGGTYDKSTHTITWNLQTLDPGTGTVTFTATLPNPKATTTICNLASIVATKVGKQVSNQACVEIVPLIVVIKPVISPISVSPTAKPVASPVLTICKTVLNMVTGDTGTAITAMPGNSVKYTMTYDNSGKGASTDTVVVDPLDTSLGGSGLNQLSDITPQDGGTYDKTTHTITWNLHELAAGGKGTVTFTAKLPTPKKATTICNVAAIVSGNGSPAVSPTACVEILPLMVVITAIPSPIALTPTAIPISTPKVTMTAVPLPQPKLKVSKTVTNNTTGQTGVSVSSFGGDQVTFAVDYSNSGTGAAKDAVVIDPLDTSLGGAGLDMLTDITPQNGGVYDKSMHLIVWKVGSLKPGKGTVTFTAKLPNPKAKTTICNFAAIGASNGSPAVSAKACAEITPLKIIIVPIPQAKLSISKVVDTADDQSGKHASTQISVDPGTKVRFTINYKNSGDGAAKGAMISDVLTGDNLEMLSKVHVDAKSGAGTYHPNTRTIEWPVDIAANSEGSVDFTAVVPDAASLKGATNICNSATIVNGTTQTVTIKPACVAVKVTCPEIKPVVTMTGPATLAPGGKGTYTVTASNGGKNTIDHSLVTVQIPNGFTVTDTTTSPGKVTPTQMGTAVIFKLPEMKSGDAWTLTVRFAVPDSYALGTVKATATMIAQSGGEKCPPVEVSTTATSNVAVGGGVLGITTSTPSTGMGGVGTLRYTIVGLCLMTSGLIVLTGMRRRNPHAYGYSSY